MKFDRCNIDRAIVMTQYDLRGFVHPLGTRSERVSPKNLSALTWNLAAFAANPSDDVGSEYREGWVSSSSSYEEYLDMCLQFARACDSSQREAVQLILKDIYARYVELKREVAAGCIWTPTHFDNYLGELSQDSMWGRWLLALEQAFMGPSDEEVREALHMLKASEVTALLESANTPGARRSAVMAALEARGVDDVLAHMHWCGINEHVSLT